MIRNFLLILILNIKFRNRHLPGEALFCRNRVAEAYFPFASDAVEIAFASSFEKSFVVSCAEEDQVPSWVH